MTSKRRKSNPADVPAEKPRYRIDLRGLIIMVIVAAPTGLLNSVLGTVAWVFALSLLPGDTAMRASYESTYVIASQFLTSLVTIGICLWAVTQFTRMPWGWGITLGAAIAFATSPLVLFFLT